MCVCFFFKKDEYTARAFVWSGTTIARSNHKTATPRAAKSKHTFGIIARTPTNTHLHKAASARNVEQHSKEQYHHTFDLATP